MARFFAALSAAVILGIFAGQIAAEIASANCGPDCGTAGSMMVAGEGVAWGLITGFIVFVVVILLPRPADDSAERAAAEAQRLRAAREHADQDRGAREGS